MKKDQVIFYLSIIKQNLHALALALTSLNPTTSAGKVLPERTIVQPKEISRGFVPVIPRRLLHHYTDGWYKGYQWQIGHPIRQRVLDKFPCNRFFAYLIARLSGSICTVSAYNIFSIFVEHSKKSQDHDFIKLICTRHEKKD